MPIAGVNACLRNIAGHRREPRVSVRIRAATSTRTRGPSSARLYPAEPDVLVKELAGDEAIKAADTLLPTVPNQLGVDYNAHVLDSILKYVAPELGWR
jgi:hypothetical protein